MTDHEVYPNAPLVSVSFELRHPRTEGLTNPQRAILRELLGDALPLMRVDNVASQTIEFGPSGPMGQMNSEEHTKFFDRRMSVVASFSPESTLVETSQYSGWGAFSELVLNVCSARNEVERLDGIGRIGLRYIDEIRVAKTESPDWSQYIKPSFLGSEIKNCDGLRLNQWQGVSGYGPEGGRSLVVRHATGDGFAIDPNAELKRKNPVAAGKFFMLDMDSFWIPETGIPAFDSQLISETIEALHNPVGAMFENCITDQLRNEVLR
ncbi:TIGR04255 family protein [Glutamicibacter mishrai]|uniref:TIGR04255 family protein n=1 Tax=Glutamicibacter mishrai TaxID=1775880 RepID=UPI003F7A4524